MKPRVVLIATGGTIASRYDAMQDRTVPSQHAEDLIANLPDLNDLADIEIDNFATVPSFDFDLVFAVRIADRINEVLRRDDVTGVVVTQGTDTMEESSYVADLLLRSEKPVAFTGAQRTHDDPFPDGPGNILDAVRLVTAAEARGLGAVICFNGQVHAARDVTKVHTSAVETFQSYDHGAVATIDAGTVVVRRRLMPRETLTVDQLETRVALLRLHMGFDCGILDACVDRGRRGIVLEAFGRGNGPKALVAAARRAIESGVTIVASSRCPVGRVLPIYGSGGGRDLEDAGVIFAGDLKGPKALVALALALSDARTRGDIAALFRRLAP